MQFGVDEAGKGPVLGSMFAAAVRADPTVLPTGIDDSKNLAPARREGLADQLRADDRVDIAVAEVPPARVDDPETDMNTLTVAAQAEALSGVVCDGDAGVVDAGDTDATRFGRRVADRIEGDLSITAEHGADEAYPLVGAASVLAKVRRDAHVTTLSAEYPETEVGSGYPSDPTTRAFLREYVAEHGDIPPCARRSWSTSQEVLAAAEQSALSEF
ncbi:ribonuclease HII [Halorientalis sp.]|jgi:ribonuclease HII|uniref:ribonuclease HII n=1 Tax=Halorientalis sp. TaxID=1931229 RepID=UPI0026316BC9|nr:ribonuclease HII [Halorientalis sp.]